MSQQSSVNPEIETTYVVNSSADVVDANDGVMTLRETINAANAGPGANKILLNADVTLSSDLGALLITDDLTITGGRIQGSGSLTDVLIVDNGADVTIENINISGGQDGIQVDNGNLTVRNATLENNFDDGIDIAGSNNKLTASNVQLKNNQDDGIDIGGNANKIALEDAILSGNIDNGLEVEGDNNSLEISDIAATKNGGYGIELKATSDNNSVTLVDSTLANNGQGNLSNTGNNNSVEVFNVDGVPNSTVTVKLAIANPSFEIPALPTIQESPDGYFLSVLSSPTKDTIPGWEAYDPKDLITGIPLTPGGLDFTDAGSQNATGFYPSGAADGANTGYAFIVDAPGSGVLGLTQTLTDELTANTRYTLQVDVGNPVTNPGLPIDLTGFPGYRVELLAGEQAIAADNNSLSIAEGAFGVSTVTYTASAKDPLLGEQLGIHLINLNAAPGVSVDFDNVRLTAQLL